MSTAPLPDVEAFLRELDDLPHHPEPAARGLFDPGREIIVTRAPGRLDVLGGIADYSGAMVLEWPLREATLCALQVDPEPRVRVVSPGAAENGRAAAFEIALETLLPGGQPLDYADARALFAREPATRWAAYVVGGLLVLARERGLRPPFGLRLLIRSDVPEGKGVSSSAALEVAAMKAMTVAYDLAIDRYQQALLCQKVENLVVGAPCGLMDQMTSSCASEGQLFVLQCGRLQMHGTHVVPDEIELWGIDSHVRHAVSGSDYGRVRVGAFMGARILALRTNRDRPLAEIDPAELAAHLEHLPVEMTGADFLDRYAGTTDPVTRVEPDVTYAVRQPTSHPVHEHARVEAFVRLLEGPCTEPKLKLMGALMYRAHESYSACGLGSAGTDRLVQLVREAGPEHGVFGAKITGGGSGGTVAVLGRRGADIGRIADAYAAETGRPSRVFSGSSPGAALFGHRLVPAVNVHGPGRAT